MLQGGSGVKQPGIHLLNIAQLSRPSAPGGLLALHALRCIAGDGDRADDLAAGRANHGKAHLDVERRASLLQGAGDGRAPFRRVRPLAMAA